MPDGLGIGDRDLLNAEITVRDYILQLSNYLNRLTAFNALTMEQANDFMLRALKSFGYSSGVDFEDRSAVDIRIINMSEASVSTRRAAQEAVDITSLKYRTAFNEGTLATEYPEAFGYAGIPVPSRSLPFFRQVVAPIVYRNDAIKRATDYGYEEGSSQWNSLVEVQAKRGAETYQLSFIQNQLKGLERVATAQEDTTKAKTLADNIREMEIFFGAQRQRAALEEGRLGEAQGRMEAWEEELAAPRAPSPEMPSGEEAVREFVEEERPGGLQRFIESELPGVLGTYQREEERARKAWWTSINRPSYEQALSGAERELKQWVITRAEGVKAGWGRELAVQAAELGRPLTGQDVSPSQWAYLRAGDRMTEASQRLYDLRGMTSEQISGRYPGVTAERKEDPLVSYLEEYPWQSEWLKLSPGQRGYSPARFKPAARWFV